MGDTLDDEWWITGEDSENETSNSPKKRTATDDSSSNAEDHSDTESKDIVPKKKKRKRRKITEQLNSDQKVQLQNKELVTAVEKYFEGKLSAVEADELQFEETVMAVPALSEDTPTSYLKTLLPKWKKLKDSLTESAGSPLVVILTSSAIRATQLIRQIADFRGENCKVAKLFAKHMKIEEQNKFLQKTVIHIGVGTPNRIKALLDAETLKLEHTKFIVLDWTWRDSKLKRLIDVKDIKTELMKLLQSHLVPCAKKTKTKLALL